MSVVGWGWGLIGWSATDECFIVSHYGWTLDPGIMPSMLLSTVQYAGWWAPKETPNRESVSLLEQTRFVSSLSPMSYTPPSEYCTVPDLFISILLCEYLKFFLIEHI